MELPAVTVSIKLEDLTNGMTSAEKPSFQAAEFQLPGVFIMSAEKTDLIPQDREESLAGDKRIVIPPSHFH